MPSSMELLLGIVCAFIGGELFLKGVLGISNWVRIPTAVTAATLAAFATSSPEISVAITAASEGKATIALGDALGSNIVNVALILGLALCIGPMKIHWAEVRREFTFALIAPCVVAGVLYDGVFSRAEGLFCFFVFVCWLIMVTRDALEKRTTIESTISARQGAIAIVFGIVGLLFLILAGRLIVSGATGIGQALGMDPFLVGATMVAFGTSTPELATALVARSRGHDEVGIGTILGSNIFNCLFIVGLTATISPYEQPLNHVLTSIIIGVVAVLILTPISGPTLGRVRGSILLIVYIVSIFMAWLTQQSIGTGHP